MNNQSDDISDIDRMMEKKGLKLIDLHVRKRKVTWLRYRHPDAPADLCNAAFEAANRAVKDGRLE